MNFLVAILGIMAIIVTFFVIIKTVKNNIALISVLIFCVVALTFIANWYANVSS